MSILYSNTFFCDSIKVDVKVKKNAVDIDIEPIPVVNTTTASTSGVLTVHGNGIGGAVPLVGGANHYVGLTNATAHFQTVGFRLFFYKGYLKCVKREMAHSYIYSNTMMAAGNVVGYNTINEPPKKKGFRESLYEPAVIWDTIRGEDAKRYIQTAVLGLALNLGIQVPSRFLDFSKMFKHANSIEAFIAFDWLAYPLIRELDNPVATRNIYHSDRHFMAPKFEPMNFKQLIEHYYGTTTSKMLEEIWKVMLVGGDYRRENLSGALSAEQAGAITQFIIGRHENEILHQAEDHFITLGDRCIQSNVFTLGPAIFKTMGFDYFYQILPSLHVKGNRRVREEAYNDHPDVAGGLGLEDSLRYVLKFMTPKKLMNCMFPAEKAHLAPDLHSLRDAVRMLKEYDDVSKIPLTLKMQYPKGLTVDFKFKTMKEMHDKISTQYTIIKTEFSNKIIPTTMVYDMLDGRERDGLRLVVPKKTSTLAVWGKLLNICIASYGDRAIDGSSLLLGVEKEGVIKYCLEFSSVIVARPDPLQTFVGPHDPKAIQDVAKDIREPYPRLVERHIGITDDTTTPEQEVYYIPVIHQFRSERNGPPTKEDREAVEHMLINWTMDNIEFFKTMEILFKESSTHYFDDLVARVAENAGQPDRLIMNQPAYENLVRALGQGVQVNQAPARHIEVPNVQIQQNELGVLNNNIVVNVAPA